MRVRTLGGLALEGSELTRPQPLLLLAYVALEGPKGRRELADLFFMHTADPRDSLSTALRHLRKEAEGSIEQVDDLIACAVDCDASDLLAQLSSGDLDHAMETYRGAFLAGLDLTLGEELEAWVYETREWLARKFRSSVLDLASELLNAGRLDEARSHAESALRVAGAPELGPEELHRVSSLLQRVGSEELAAVKELMGEYGIEPESVLPSGDLAGRNSLPAPRTSFIGRSDELDRLAGLLLNDGARLVTVQGFGGIGKTRLALEFAMLQRATEPAPFPGGVHFVSMEQARSQRDVLGRVGLALGVRPPQAYDVELLAQAIGRDPTLLVLDNFEHLDPVEIGLPALLDACVGARVLVTSRRRLELKGEYVLHLGGLPTERSEHAQTTDAASLFIERARQARLSRAFEDHDGRAIECICGLLGGYPLGIELAASMTRILPPEQIFVDIERSFRDLGDAPVDAPDRHRSIRAAFEPSWSQLPPVYQGYLEALAVLPAPFDHRVAGAIANAPIAALMRLVDRSMLGNDGRRFRFHPVVHAFVREAAQEDEELLLRARSSLVTWTEQTLEEASSKVGTEPRSALHQLESNLANLLAGVEGAIELGLDARAVHMMKSLVVDCNYLSARGANARLLDLLDRTIDLAAQAEDYPSAHHLATKLGNGLRELLGEMEASLRAYRRALDLAERAQMAGRTAILLGILGAMAHILDDGDPFEFLERGRSLAESIGDDVALSHVLQNWSYVVGQGDDVDRVLAVSREAVEVSLRLKARMSPVPIEVDQKLFFSLFNLGEAFRESGDSSQSLTHRERALEIARERDQTLWAAYALQEIGTTRHERGEPELALEALAEALDLYRSAGASYHIDQVEAFMSEHGYGPPERPASSPA